MDEHDWLADRFEEHRGHLRAVAYRMLGSLSEADDAVQESWLRLSRADTSDVENLGGWLTTVVGRVCLDMLRSRTSRREEPLDEQVPEPTVSRDGRGRATPSRKRCWPTRSVWRCWWCWRRWLPPSGSPSCCTTCSPCPSTRSPPSWGAPRPRRGSSPAAPAGGCRGGRTRGAAFAAASTPISTASERWSTPSSPPRAAATSTRLLAVLDPDVVLRADRAAVRPGRTEGDPRCRGRGRRAMRGGARAAQPALVNGAVGVVVAPRGRLLMVLGFTIRDGKIVAIDAIADPAACASSIWRCSANNESLAIHPLPENISRTDALREPIPASRGGAKG